MEHILLRVMVYTVFSLVIIASDTPLSIKLVFLSVLLILLLPSSDKFLTKPRLVRKSIAATGGVLLFTGLLILFSFVSGETPIVFVEFFEFAAVVVGVMFYATLGFFVFGVPVSIVSDMVADRFSKRFVVAGVVHLLGGLALVPVLSAIPLVCALIFWLFDEALRKRQA